LRDATVVNSPSPDCKVFEMVKSLRYEKVVTFVELIKEEGNFFAHKNQL
jgi:hypothetical protein